MIRTLDKNHSGIKSETRRKEMVEEGGRSHGDGGYDRKDEKKKRGNSDLGRSMRVHLYGTMRSELLLHLHLLPYHGLVECAGR